MSPFKSIKGRALGKLLEGYKSSDIGKGFGSGDDSGGSEIGGPHSATGGDVEAPVSYTHLTLPTTERV